MIATHILLEFLVFAEPADYITSVIPNQTVLSNCQPNQLLISSDAISKFLPLKHMPYVRILPFIERK